MVKATIDDQVTEHLNNRMVVGGTTSTLPSKESSTFKNILKYYETKQYKKALKCAESILKKFPNHGETLALKGLVLSGLNRKQEAYELVKLGLKNDLKSHICWHVYGLLYRADQDYKEAAKAYLQALKIDPDNIQILRDLALLQVQTRDYDGLILTRRKLVTLKPGNGNHWLGFAVAYHLKGEHEVAVKILDAYEGTIDTKPKSGSTDSNKKDATTTLQSIEERYEISETILYHAMIMEEMESWKEALEYLDKNKSKIVDVLSHWEFRAKLLVNLLLSSTLSEYQQMYPEEPEHSLNKLLDFNPNNLEYINMYIKVFFFRRGISISAKEKNMLEEKVSLEACDELLKQFTSSTTLERLSLELSSGNDFFHRLKKYFDKFLCRGIPSMLSDFKSLYSHRAKVNIIEKVLNEYYETTKVFSSQSENDQDTRGKELQSPDLALWCLYFLAQHYYLKKDTTKALECIDKAIFHTPTLVESYTLKAKIYKQAGRMLKALELANEARMLDLADRYLNCYCIRIALELNLIPLANFWMSLFTKESGSKETQSIYDLQVIWLELASAEAHFRLGELSRALKLLMAVQRHFDDILEDQFDFHSYCLRKATLRSYVRVLRLEDNLFGQKYYLRNIKGLVKVFLAMIEKGDEAISHECAETQEMLAKLNWKEEKKKSRHKQQSNKTEKTKNSENTSRPRNNASFVPTSNQKHDDAGNTDISQSLGWMEMDPNGEELYKSITNPLNEAVKYINILEKYAAEEMEVRWLAFQVAIKEQKLVPSLKALLHAEGIVHRELDQTNNVYDDKKYPKSNNYYVFLMMKLEFVYMLERNPDWMEPLPVSIVSFIREECNRVCEEKTFSELFLQSWECHHHSMSFVISSGELLHKLQSLDKYPWILEALTSKETLTENEVEDYTVGIRHLSLLEKIAVHGQVQEHIRECYRQRFPEMDCFEKKEDIEAAKKAFMERELGNF
eukprot:jgi/Galph1/1157/GphlegSOOS_G5880.1